MAYKFDFQARMPNDKQKPLKAAQAERRKKRAERLAKAIKAIPAAELMDLLPEELLRAVAAETEVDHQVKHLTGRLLVLLLLQSILKDRDESLRSLEGLYNSASFERFSGKGKHQTRHSSLAERLAHVEVTFFERLYEGFLANVRQRYQRQLDKEFGWLWRFDSTMVSVSAALSQIGMRVGARSKQGEGRKQIKFTVGLQGLLPSSVQVFHEQAALSEERALRQLIDQSAIKPNEIVVFDRGLKSRKTLASFAERGLFFVTRLTKPRYLVVRPHKALEGRQHGTLRFVSDQIVQLYTSGQQAAPEPTEFRLVEAVCCHGKHAGKTFYFLTNMIEQTAFAIADLYLKRWDIEVFFRFLKQQIGLRNLLAYNENGLTAVFYVRLLCATMLQLFCFLNQRRDFTIAKQQFADQLHEDELFTQAVLAGANPDKLRQLLG